MGAAGPTGSQLGVGSHHRLPFRGPELFGGSRRFGIHWSFRLPLSRKSLRLSYLRGGHILVVGIGTLEYFVPFLD